MLRGDDNKLSRSNSRLTDCREEAGAETIKLRWCGPKPEHFKASMDNGGHCQQETEQCNNEIKW